MVSVLLKQLELASETETDFWKRVLWLSGKTQTFQFIVQITGAVDMKMDWFIPEKKYSFKMLVLSFSSKLDLGSYISKIASNKIRALIHFVKFFSSEAAL